MTCKSAQKQHACVCMPNAVSTTQINRITSTIIEAAIRIHRTIGPGLLEKAYFGCLCFELSSVGLRIETQKALPLIYRGVNIECAYRADLIVEGLVIVEVKALKRSSADSPQAAPDLSASRELPVRAATRLRRGDDEGRDRARHQRPVHAECLCGLCGLCVEKPQ